MTNTQINRINKAYSTATGYVPSKSRKTKQVQLRSALACAYMVYGLMTDDEAADAVGLTRTTCLFHRKRHSENLMYWGMYQEYYRIAVDCIDAVIGGPTHDTYKLTDKLNELSYQLTKTNLKHYRKYINHAIKNITHEKA